MNKIILLCCALFLCCDVAAQETAFVECRVDQLIMSEVQLYEVTDGCTQSIAKAKCTGKGYAGFQFVPRYEGFYMVGDDFKNQYPVYIKPGDRVSVVINDSCAHLAGKKNSRENKILYEWRELSHYVWSRSVLSYKYKDCSYKAYFPRFEQFVLRANRFCDAIRSGNARFDDLMKRSIGFEKDYYALAYLQAFRKPELRDTAKIAYYATIYSPDKLQDTVLLQMPYGIRFLDRYAMNARKPRNMNIPTVHLLVDSIPNDQLKGELILQEAERMSQYADYVQLADEFMARMTPAQQTRLKLIGAKLYTGDQGGKAENFTYPDINGKMVSLTDFKGKIVVVDVWATWCGPCRAQIPFLTKLEEEMKGKDVVFVSVSVDSRRDYDKWKKMVEDMNMGGVQLFADQGRQIKEAYKIVGIPRFMVFDRQGNVVSKDAPRPSQPELKRMIEAELNKRERGD